jgi:hypothetical protein
VAELQVESQQEVQSEDSEEEGASLRLAAVERQERLDAVMTRAHNCLLTGQKLNTQMILLLKGWKATL